MSGYSSGWSRSALWVAVVIASFTLVVAAPGADAQETDADAGRYTTIEVVYTVDPLQGWVDVTETIVSRNDRAPTTQQDGSRTSYFWTGQSLWIPRGAVDPTVLSGGEQLPLELVTESNLADLFLATYPTQLQFGEARTLDVTYRLETFGALDDGSRRLNAAFFNLTLVTCCQFQEASIEVRIPSGYRVTPPNDARFVRYEDESHQVFRYRETQPVADYMISEWFGFDENGFKRTAIAAGDAEIVLVSLPDTPDWTAATSQLIGELAAATSDLTQTDWPLRKATFRQGGSRFDFESLGYGNLSQAEVRLPEAFSARGLALTIASPLLPGEPFTESYLNEGIRTDFAAAALSSIDNHIWEPPPLVDAQFDPTVDGFWLMRQVSDQIGHDGLVTLLEIATSDETAFVGSGSPEPMFTGTPDWRRFLDVAEQRTGMASVSNLFATHVLDADQAAQLDRRNVLVARYDDLLDVGQHPGPVGVRSALTNWQLDEAERLLDAMDRVLEQHQQTATATTDVGLSWNIDVPDWSDATTATMLNLLARPYNDRRQVLAQIVNAERSLASDRGLVEDLGFDETDANTKIDRAKTAFEADDLVTARAELASFAALDNAASSAGRTALLLRFVAPGVALVLASLAVWRITATRRRQRRRGATSPHQGAS